MEIIKKEKITILKPQDGKKLRKRNDNYTKVLVNNEYVEHFPRYFSKVCLPASISTQKIEELFIEEEELTNG